MIKKQLKVVAEAFYNLKKEFKLGMSVCKIRYNFLSFIKSKLTDCKFKYDFLCGKQTLEVDGVTKNYIPKMGDTLLIDISVKYNGLWSDVCRTFFVGEPSETQKEYFNLIVNSIRAGEKVLQKGQKALKIYEEVNSQFKKNGFQLIHHAGHKIGTRALMQPQFLEGKEQKIQLSNYYTIESGIYNECGIRLENDYIINKDGCENLFEGLMPLKIEEYILI